MNNRNGSPAADTAAIMRARAWGSSGRAREVRIAARLTLREVAAVLEVHFTAVQAWETGRKSPRGDRAERYGQLLEELDNGAGGLR